MSILPRTTRRNMPMYAYEQQDLIPEKDRCQTCKGLGWTVWKHGYPNNEYHQCLLCDGSGRKKEEVQDEPQSE
jgi:excinuclease UvrABC ATPase subunit